MWTGGPYLSDDGLHPNAAGDRVLAQAVAYALVRIFGSSILATESK
jgi:lysophospholipase L1-like esterase